MSTPRERAIAEAVAIRRAAGRLQRRMRAEAPPGLPAAKLSVLAHLERAQDLLTPGDLAAAERVKPQSVSRVVAELETEGLVTRTRDARDARQFRISITDAGSAALHADAHERNVWLADAMILELSPVERRVMRGAADLMDRLADVDRIAPVADDLPASAVPMLPTHNAAITEAFFRSIGFTVGRGSDDEYLMLDYDGISLHFFAKPDVDPFATAGMAGVAVPNADTFRTAIIESGAAEVLSAPGAGDARALRGRWRETRNLARVGTIEDKPWRVREFALFDPTNNLLRVWHPISLNRRRNERRRSMES
jgi:DNA-binding MarR family transcriptional regulator